MPQDIDQLIETNKANAQALQGMATHAFAGIQKLIELNLAAVRASMLESSKHTQACLGARDVQQLLTVQAGLFQPLAMKYLSYRSQVYAIAAETGADMIKDYSDVVENVEKNLPGAEPVVVVLKSAVNASQMAIETAQGTARKAMELVESNLAAVNHHPSNGSTTAAARRRG
jgi:phasin family protein